LAHAAKVEAIRDFIRWEPYSQDKAFAALLTYVAADVEGGADAAKAADVVRRAKRAFDFGDKATAISILLEHVGGTVARPVTVAAGGGR
jgi:hypothetical protein